MAAILSRGSELKYMVPWDLYHLSAVLLESHFRYKGHFLHTLRNLAIRPESMVYVFSCDIAELWELAQCLRFHNISGSILVLLYIDLSVIMFAHHGCPVIVSV